MYLTKKSGENLADELTLFWGKAKKDSAWRQYLQVQLEITIVKIADKVVRTERPSCQLSSHVFIFSFSNGGESVSSFSKDDCERNRWVA